MSADSALLIGNREKLSHPGEGKIKMFCAECRAFHFLYPFRPSSRALYKLYTLLPILSAILAVCAEPLLARPT